MTTTNKTNGPEDEGTSVLAAFGERDFSIFWLGAFITNAGGWFQSLAVPYVLFLITGSPFWVGIAAAAQFVPIMALGPLGGAIADGGNRRNVVISMQAVRAASALGMAVIWIAGWHHPGILLGLAVLTGCAQGISMPSWQSLVNDLVPRHLLTSAVTLNTIQFNLARSFGPAIGGLILYGWGPAIAFILTFAAVLGVIVALLLVKSLPTQRTRPEHSGLESNPKQRGGFLRALRYVPGEPGVLTALVLVFFVGVMGMPIFQHVITFSADELNAGELGLTVLNLGLGIGTLAGVAVLGRMQRRALRSAIASISLPVYGLGLMAFAVSPNIIAATISIIVIGLCFLLSLTVGNNTVQLIVADQFRGRILALNVMIYTGSVALGSTLQGWVADQIGNRPTVFGAGLLLILSAVALRFGPARLRLSRLNDIRDEPVTGYSETSLTYRLADGKSSIKEREADMAISEHSLAIPTAPAFDGAAMRQVMGSYPTGVAAVTGIGRDGEPLGMVVGTFSSVSLDPPLVSFLPMRSSRSFAALREAGHFCVNILAADQEPLCRQLSGPGTDKFAGIGWRPAPHGAPILNGVVGWIECAYDNIIEAGDHFIVLGSVQQLAVERDTLPLLFFQRGYGRFTPGSLMASDSRDFAQSVRRAEHARTEMEQLAIELGAEVSLLAALGEEYVFVATSSESGASPASLPGTRLPFVPPLGMLLVGEPGAPAESAWIAKLPAHQHDRRALARQQLSLVRERGWSLTLRGAHEHDHLDELVNSYTHPFRTPEQERGFLSLLDEMSILHEPAEVLEDSRYDVLQISSPVRNPAGEVVLVLRLSGLPRQSTGRNITVWINRLKESAAFIEQRLVASSATIPVNATGRHKVLDQPATA